MNPSQVPIRCENDPPVADWAKNQNFLFRELPNFIQERKIRAKYELLHDIHRRGAISCPLTPAGIHYSPLSDRLSA